MTEIVVDPGALQVGPHEKKSSSWWGVMCLIATEAALFSYLEFSYYYFDVQLPHSWRPAIDPAIRYSLPGTCVLILSSVAVWFGEKSLKKGKRTSSFVAILVGFVLGLLFLFIQSLEWRSKTFTPQTGPYGSLFFTTTGFHMAHVVVGVIGLFFILLWMALGYIDPKRNSAVSNVATYWHFVDAVWVTLFFMFYVSPHLWW